MTPAEFFAWEETQLEKHEYHLGEIFAMTGGRPRHNLIESNTLIELAAATRPRGCKTFTGNQAIAVPPGERYVYPDVTTACGTIEVEPGTHAIQNPTVIVEVLSPNTEDYNRSKKWGFYQTIPSLTDYLLVSQRSIRVEHYRRVGSSSWALEILGEGGTVTLANGGTLLLESMYQGVFELPGDDEGE